MIPIIENPLEINQEDSAERLLSIIFHYMARIANENRLQKVLLLMADMGREMVMADRCAVWLIDEETKGLFTAIAHGVEEIRIPFGRGIVGASIAAGEVLLVDDAYQDERHNRDNDQLTGYRTRSVLCIPFRSGTGEVIGAYQAINKLPEDSVFTDADIRHLTLAAAYTGKALEETGQHARRVAQYSYLLALRPLRTCSTRLARKGPISPLGSW